MGLPRIYAIAVAIVHDAGARLSLQGISDFLISYQKVDPLTIGELWALPLMLRLRLVEWVQHLGTQVDRRMRDGELASFWGNRLLITARRKPQHLSTLLAELATEMPHPSAHFAEELLEHLFDEEAVLPQVKKWLSDSFSLPIADVVHEEQVQEAAEQVAFSNAVVSLIFLSQLSWSEFL